MKRLALAAALFLSACASAAAQPRAACPPAGQDAASLRALKEADWAVADDAARNALARALTACLASSDPELRDRIAFEGLSHFMRAGQLSTDTLRAIKADLVARLSAAEGQGFERPFAVLALSEVARTDRLNAWMSAEERTALLDVAISYFTAVRDYRGFDEREGWRHGVAHGADLLLQLGINPTFGKPEMTRVRDAIETQVAPDGHFYIYGESERLARPIIFMAQRGQFSEEEWTQWFARFLTAGEDSYRTQAGLARVHNVKAFLQVIHVSIRLTENTADDAMFAGVDAAIRATP